MCSRTANLLGALGLALADGQSAELAASSGLTPNDAAALNAVAAAPGCSIRAVQVALGITHPGTVRTIDRLAAAGLVERRAGMDGRTVSLHLTGAGAQVWQRQADARIAWLEQAIARLAPGERAGVERIVSALLAAITGDEASAERICRLCDENRCPQDRCPVTLAMAPST
ncbi:MarR family winged helix-turn-helix transcriptional regulator [Nonomuraea typhae]|uniref:MarR family winged helix-turn-helix transcriptional regulator n=1 Tax=Nonomuraea typhae TaxID=2603600 RepID=A0ABW7Z9P8_9ACTN